MTGYTLHLASQKKMAPKTPQTVNSLSSVTSRAVILAIFLAMINIGMAKMQAVV